MRPSSIAAICLAAGLMAAPSAEAALLTYTVGASNLQDQNQTFDIQFSLPFTDGPFDYATTLFSDTLTYEGTDRGTGSVTPNLHLGISQSLVDTVPIPGLDIGSGCATTIAVTTCSSSDDGSLTVSYSAGASGTLTLDVSFILSPHTSYSVSGSTELLIPEPATLLVLGPAFLGLAAAVRRRVGR
jgi:hypothetical protein